MNIVLAIAAAACAVAALVWARSARMRYGLIGKLEEEVKAAAESSNSFIALQLARIGFRKEIHTVAVYGILAIGLGVLAASDTVDSARLLSILIVIPAVVSVSWWRTTGNEIAMLRQQLSIEKRAEEALEQENLAPKAWAGRLAPDELPDLTDFEVGRVYQAGSGLMAGDFFDVFQVAPTRVAAVIGDVAGKGIESSITAFQAKYLLRVFLRQFRDPAQALQELNEQMSATGHSEEFISLVVVVFDTEAGTLRFSSAGHPAAWVWHEREVQPLRSTGPLLMLAPGSNYYSRELELDVGDMVVLYTDGLAEARRGDELFGEDRIAALLRRDPTVAPDVLCKSLLEAARNFAEGPVDDDVAILAVKRI
ncbi:MAG: PP2C family protein-serine/threonine phosphatase [Acidimicrobiales bacterium]|jgi:serine phosphatase RsbU (regulator of sigma subunit)